MKFEIICPVHDKKESIKLPDDYSPSFNGHIPCGNEGKWELLKITLEYGKILKLELVDTNNF